MSGSVSQKEKEIKVKIYDIAITEGLEGFDPRHVVSLRSMNRKSIEVIALEEIVSLAEKVTIYIPDIKLNHTSSIVTDIRSVQLLSRDGKKLIIAEIAGPMDKQVVLWVQAVAKTMIKHGVISAFFPAHTSRKVSSFFYGEMDDLDDSFVPILSQKVQNLRVLEDGESLLFATGKDVLTIHMSDIKERYWEKHCTVLYSGNKEIAFLGRFQSKKVHVTFVSGEVGIFKLGSHSFQKLDRALYFSSATSAFLGLIDRGISAAISEKKDSGESVLTLIPQSMMQTAA